MRITLLVHILAGGLGLLSGYVALAAAKGGPLHRKVGTFFVYVMVTMAITGLLISAVEGVAPAINVPSALLTFYLVITSLTTVGAPAGWSRRMDVAAMLLAVAIGVGCLILAAASIGRGGAEAGLAYPLVMFGGVALASSRGDLRIIRTGALRGKPRIIRHLWRMCFAILISSIAFYVPPGRLPDALHTPPVIAAGLLVPIVSMIYWKWRLRAKRSYLFTAMEAAK
jgi:uncharacterized membrane protein